MSSQPWEDELFNGFNSIKEYDAMINLGISLEPHNVSKVSFSVKEVRRRDRGDDFYTKMLEKDIVIDIYSRSILLAFLNKCAKLSVRWRVTINYYTGENYNAAVDDELISLMSKFDYIEELDIVDTGSRYAHMFGFFMKQRSIRKLSVIVDDNSIQQVASMLMLLDKYPTPFTLNLAYGGMTDTPYGSMTIDTTEITKILSTLSRKKIMISLNVECGIESMLEMNIRSAFDDDAFTPVSNTERVSEKSEKTLIVDNSIKNINLTQLLSSNAAGTISFDNVSSIHRIVYNDILNDIKLSVWLDDKNNKSKFVDIGEMIFNTCKMDVSDLVNTITDNYKNVKRITFINCGILSAKNTPPENTNKRFITSDKE